MKERPIIMRAEAVRAIIENRKTQFRRVVKPQDAVVCVDHKNGTDRFEARRGSDLLPCPHGQPGDVLWPAREIPSVGRNYCADVCGRIWSRARDGETWRLLKGTPQSKGYLTCTPAVGRVYKTRLAHRLVAEAFYGFEPDGLTEVRHLNRDVSNNDPRNLDWGTQQDNWADRLLHGGGTGERHHAAKLTWSNVGEIRKSDDSQRQLSARYGVSQGVIWGVKNGYLWVENPPTRPPNCERYTSPTPVRVTGVRVEGLQEIDGADCYREGINCPLPVEKFHEDWDSAHKPGKRWGDNPWIWCVSFERELSKGEER